VPASNRGRPSSSSSARPTTPRVIPYETFDRDDVPPLYAWKSAKRIRQIHFMAEDELGFWERYGYNNHADPRQEERFL